MSRIISIKVRNIDKVAKKISKLPLKLRGIATEAAAHTLIGNQRTGLQHYPTRKKHGIDGKPYKWQTAKQRRAFFESNGFGGGIPTVRTYKLRAGWKVKNDGAKTVVINDAPYARYVQGDDIQRGHIADGWRTFRDTVANNTKAMIKSAQSAVNKYIKENW